MDEQRLERELRAGLADWLDPAIGGHPRWVTSPAAGRVAGIPSRRAFSGRWGLLWAAALLALLLVALLAATVFVGARRPDHAVVVAPSPTRTVPPGEATILATTKAKPLPPPATCPPGTDPDIPGPADQERPSVAWGEAWTGAVAFDRRAGRIVLLAREDGSGNGVEVGWTCDVCTNTWERMRSADGPPDDVSSLVYDADSDRTLAFTDTGRVWNYDLSRDQWTKGAWLPRAGDTAGVNETFGTRFYHDPSGQVVLYDGAAMWAYDVDTNTLTEVPQRPDPALPTGSELPDGRVAFGYDTRRDLVVAVVVPYVGEGERGWMPTSTKSGETWTFDPGTGAWWREASAARSDLIVCGLSSFPKGSTDCWQTNGRAVYDEATGLVVFMNRDWGRPTAPGRVDAYDTRLGTWGTLYTPGVAWEAHEATWCASMPPVYDPLNERIVCLGKGRDSDIAGVSAFSTATGQWRWLLAP